MKYKYSRHEPMVLMQRYVTASSGFESQSSDEPYLIFFLFTSENPTQEVSCVMWGPLGATPPALPGRCVMPFIWCPSYPFSRRAQIIEAQTPIWNQLTQLQLSLCPFDMTLKNYSSSLSIPLQCDSGYSVTYSPVLHMWPSRAEYSSVGLPLIYLNRRLIASRSSLLSKHSSILQLDVMIIYSGLIILPAPFISPQNGQRSAHYFR